MDRLAFLLLLGLASLALSAKLPSTWKSCKAAKDMNKCLIPAVTAAAKELMDGFPKLGVPTLDPLVLSEVKIQGRGQVAVNITFKDLKIKNFKSFMIHDIKVDWDKHDVQMNITVKEPVIADGEYEINGKVLLLPIVGKGPTKLVLHDTKTILHLWGSEMMKNGKKYLDVQKSTFTIDVSLLKIQLDNLFNGDKRLSDTMNKFLNENWKLILDDMVEPVVSAIGEAFRQISNQVFHRIPLNEIAP